MATAGQSRNAAAIPQPADISKTSASRFPLVHKLIHFADLRNFYKDMREALKSANRRAGAQQGLVTKARKQIEALQQELAVVEQERQELLAYRDRAEQEASQLAELLPRFRNRLLQVQQIEQALANLADVKEAVDQQDRHVGVPTEQSMQDLKRAVEHLLERADAIDFHEDEPENTHDAQS
jgi:septal ring factor EnvC (AmiA/AmiB activator)